MSAKIVFTNDEDLLRDLAGQYANGKCDLNTFFDVFETIVDKAKSAINN